MQLANPLDHAGPNREPLVDCQRRSLARWPDGVERAGEYERDPDWRPLSDAEIAFYRRRTADGERLVFAAAWEPGDRAAKFSSIWNTFSVGGQSSASEAR